MCVYLSIIFQVVSSIILTSFRQGGKVILTTPPPQYKLLRNPPRLVLTLHILWIILRKISECLFVAVFDIKKLILQHQLNRFYLEYYCKHVPGLVFSRLSPIVVIKYVFKRYKAEKMPSLSAFLVWESKSNLTISPTPLIR